MKQVYTYSEKQERLYNDNRHFCFGLRTLICFIEGKLFTQQQSFEDDEEIDFTKINNWDDNVIVHISYGLPRDEDYYEEHKEYSANTDKENVTYTRR